MVVCIGMGTSLGSHYRGGALGELLQSYGDLRGFIVVAACGNEGNTSHHFHQEELGARQETDVELRVDSREDGFTTELWCGADLTRRRIQWQNICQSGGTSGDSIPFGRDSGLY